MEPPLITTVIPTFRRPHLLRRAIRSVLRQTFGRFRVCCYDNASGDETFTVVSGFARQDARVTYHCHSKNIGGLANFGYGLARVDTPYFSILSDDDVLLPRFFETAMRSFREHPDAAFCAGSVIIASGTGRVLNVPMQSWQREGIFYPAEGLVKTVGSNAPIWTGIVFRRDVLKSLGNLDLESWIADMDFVSRAAARFPFVATKEPCAIYFDHEESGSYKLQLSNYWPSCLRGIQAICEDQGVPRALRDRFEAMQRRHVARVIFTMGVKALEAGNIEVADQAGRILKSDLGQSWRGTTVLLMAAEGRVGRMLRGALALSLKARRGAASLNGSRSRLQTQYGNLVERFADRDAAPQEHRQRPEA